MTAKQGLCLVFSFSVIVAPLFLVTGCKPSAQKVAAREALLSAAPHPDPNKRTDRIILQGDVPSPSNVPSGCAFRTRCPLARDICAREQPKLREVAPGLSTACHFATPHPISKQRSAA